MSNSAILALLPNMLDEFCSLALNPKIKPTQEQIERLTALKKGAEGSALVAELGVSAIGAVIGTNVGELDDVHIRNLGWLLELLGDLSGAARHIEFEANNYLQMARLGDDAHPFHCDKKDER